jgi:SCP-2 sterol transfer family/Mycothiol maleylpyruvate isomerase N-terminal domain
MKSDVTSRGSVSLPDAELQEDATFDPHLLANDLDSVCDIYARFFATLDTARWNEPVSHSGRQWTAHETIAHLCALNGAGLESIQHTLRDESYIFRGLDDRYHLNAFNRQGIDERLSLAPDALCAEFLRIHHAAASIARTLHPEQAALTAVMPIYNRPVSIVEALGIMMMHAGLIHSAQVAEPAGVPPLWTELAPEIRHRVIGRVLRAFSLLYRRDIGRSLRATLVFRVDGPGGGEWHVCLAPESATSGEGAVNESDLVIHLHETDDFCQMLTGRLHLPTALMSGHLKLHGEVRLFLRMSKLFSVDARP